MTTLCERNAIKITEVAPHLSSRVNGREARARLSELIQQGDTVELDLERSRLTPSFADECFGRLAAEIGAETFRDRVHLKNVDPGIRTLLRHVVSRRLAESRG